MSHQPSPEVYIRCFGNNHHEATPEALEARLISDYPNTSVTLERRALNEPKTQLFVDTQVVDGKLTVTQSYGAQAEVNLSDVFTPGTRTPESKPKRRDGPCP
ncbi:hypothetical protein AB6D11_18525 [Vibrio splendidus]